MSRKTKYMEATVKINRDVVEICCFERKSGKNHASHFYCSRPRGRSELELDSESVSSETTWLGYFSCDVEVDACLDVEACASLVFGFLVACCLDRYYYGLFCRLFFVLVYSGVVPFIVDSCNCFS